MLHQLFEIDRVLSDKVLPFPTVTQLQPVTTEIMYIHILFDTWDQLSFGELASCIVPFYTT